MSEENKNKTQLPVYVLLDTNILQYLNNPVLAKELLTYLEEIKKTGFEFAISDFSIFESLAGIPKQKETQLTNTLQAMPRFAVIDNVLLVAAQLTTVYRMEKAEFESIAVGDKIIAATSLLNGSLILTANSNDFPRPIFSETHKKLIFYKEKSKDRMISIYLLSPDFEFVKFRYDNRP